jgi:hypothetical protein
MFGALHEEVAMVSLMSLWIPILLSAVIVFIASSLFHTVLPIHRNDFRKVPSEDSVMEALRKFDIPPGDYLVPCAANPKDMKSPEFIDKMTKGPVAFMTVMPSGRPSMGKSLAQWFVYCVIVSIFAAYITGRTLEPGVHYLRVFRVAGCMAFTGYSLALLQDSIWYRRAWSTTFKSVIDGLIYGLLTAGTFGWLWPA